MSMATRCTACGTVFRVVPDQLRISEGWVRCGRCSEVFNALEHMVDVAADDRPIIVRAGVAEVAAAPVAKFEVVAFSDAQAQPEEAADVPVSTPELRADLRAPSPTFVQQAERAARWQQPRVKAVLWAAGLAALLALAAQVGVEYRELVAARWPASQVVVETLCGCRIGPPRLIEALAVDSSGLVRVEGSGHYRLSVVLRNRAAIALALPAVDLTLTDSQGRVIARRALAAKELGAASDTIAAASELPLQATLAVLERPVSGYTIEVFYP